jgi:hypothetical protein
VAFWARPGSRPKISPVAHLTDRASGSWEASGSWVELTAATFSAQAANGRMEDVEKVVSQRQEGRLEIAESPITRRLDDPHVTMGDGAARLDERWHSWLRVPAVGQSSSQRPARLAAALARFSSTRKRTIRVMSSSGIGLSNGTWTEPLAHL